MKILIIVLSHKDNGIYSDFYESQKKTWDSINVEGVETYYLFGNHDCNEIVGNEILVDVIENNFNNCGYKTLKSFILTKDIEYDYIFRTNSSSYVDKNLLLEYIKDKPLDNYYSGVIGNHNGIKFSSGCGYFISRNLVQLLIDNSDRWNHNHIDDVLVGELLRTLGHRPTSNPRFDVEYHTDIPTNYFHYRLKTFDRINDIKNMYKIHQLKNYGN